MSAFPFGFNRMQRESLIFCLADVHLHTLLPFFFTGVRGEGGGHKNFVFSLNLSEFLLL